MAAAAMKAVAAVRVAVLVAAVRVAVLVAARTLL
jgi:hypothetical protein